MQVRVVGQGEQTRGRENPSMTRSHARNEREKCRDADKQQMQEKHGEGLNGGGWEQSIQKLCIWMGVLLLVPYTSKNF